MRIVSRTGVASRGRERGLTRSLPIFDTSEGGRALYRIAKSVGAVAVLTLTLALSSTAASAAKQDADNSANSAAANVSDTTQKGNQHQDADNSSGNHGCYSYCTGGGGNISLQGQLLGQASATEQYADSKALAKQNAVNANVPVTIVGKGHVKGGSDGGAKQDLDNSANSAAANVSDTTQKGNQSQEAENSSGNDGCSKFCTGGGGNISKQKQALGQESETEQDAASKALAKQNAVNANVPVTIVGHDKGKDGKNGHDGWNGDGESWGGGAKQDADNTANSAAANVSDTTQKANQHQDADNSSGNDGGGKFAAGGGGNISAQAQGLFQLSETAQSAASKAFAGQFPTNANSPINIGG
jgi:hypothetical protein